MGVSLAGYNIQRINNTDYRAYANHGEGYLGSCMTLADCILGILVNVPGESWCGTIHCVDFVIKEVGEIVRPLGTLQRIRTNTDIQYNRKPCSWEDLIDLMERDFDGKFAGRVVPIPATVVYHSDRYFLYESGQVWEYFEIDDVMDHVAKVVRAKEAAARSKEWAEAFIKLMQIEGSECRITPDGKGGYHWGINDFDDVYAPSFKTMQSDVYKWLAKEGV